MNSAEKKYLFVCGLQRSGTSVLARNLGKLEGCSSFKNTGVLQDEGQFLQDVYLPDSAFGGSGRYGLDERAHLTEESKLLTPANIARLHACWDRHWNPHAQICLEKTPGNLIMTRFLQAAFPNSYFVVVKRHPVPVSMATQRWKVSLSSLHRLFDHWLRCYGLFEADKSHLKRLYEFSYEDYIKAPSEYHEKIAEFIGTNARQDAMEPLSDVHNKKYFERWGQLLDNSPFRGYYRHIANKYEPRFAEHGYSLLNWSGSRSRTLTRPPADTALGALYSAGADAHAFLNRATRRSEWFLKRQLRAGLPEPVKGKIKDLLKKETSERESRGI